MKPYEIARLLAEPFLPVLHGKVRRETRTLLSKETKIHPGKILDVGGRKSPYTIGLPASITVLDIPRKSEIQQQFHLGLNAHILDKLQRYRSNITEIILQDMTKCTLPSASLMALSVLK